MKWNENKNWFINVCAIGFRFFCEGDEPSSKRLVGILGAFTLFVSLILNCGTKLTQQPSDTLVNAVALLSFGGLGLTSFEKFFTRRQTSSKTTVKKAEVQEVTKEEETNQEPK